jgi:hypothetical protein
MAVYAAGFGGRVFSLDLSSLPRGFAPIRRRLPNAVTVWHFDRCTYCLFSIDAAPIIGLLIL